MIYQEKRDLMTRRLVEARHAIGQSQFKVARATGIGESTIAAAEIGGHVLNALHAATLAKYYGVSLEWLCGVDSWE